MHSTGIEVDNALKADFQAALTSESACFLKVAAENDKFVKKAESKSTGDRDNDIKAMSDTLEANNPCYLINKLEGNWSIWFYCPPTAQVRDKMVFAGSSSALKRGLGVQSFGGKDYHLTSPEECTWADYQSAIAAVDDSCLTMDEITANEAHLESELAMSQATITVNIDMPLKIQDDAKAAIQSVCDGKQQSVILRLDKDTEEMECCEVGDIDTNALPSKLPDTEPRFVLTRYRHENDGKSVDAPFFVYYCPDAAVPKNKMFYSASKSIVMKFVQTCGLESFKQIETNVAEEVSTSEMHNELYPKIVKATTFKKPTMARGGGKRKLKFGFKKKK